LRSLKPKDKPVMADEDMAEAPPPTWRAHLFSVFAPEGYNLAPLLQEIGGGSRPRIVVVDVAALSGGSADPEAVAKALATKVANDKVAAVDAKKAAIAAAAAAAAEAAAEAAAAEAAAKAAAEEAGVPYVPPASAPAAAPAAVEPPFDSPPPVEKAADAYYLLQNFPRSAAEAAALAKEGVVIDTFVAFEMDSECLRVCKGEPPPVPAEGETELPPPTLLEPTALQTELAALIGVDGSGLEQAVLLTLKGLAPDEWNTPAAVLSRLSALTCARLPPPSPSPICHPPSPLAYDLLTARRSHPNPSLSRAQLCGGTEAVHVRRFPSDALALDRRADGRGHARHEPLQPPARVRANACTRAAVPPRLPNRASCANACTARHGVQPGTGRLRCRAGRHCGLPPERHVTCKRGAQVGDAVGSRGGDQGGRRVGPRAHTRPRHRAPLPAASFWARAHSFLGRQGRRYRAQDPRPPALPGQGTPRHAFGGRRTFS
jgi:hypothetical protein